MQSEKCLYICSRIIVKQKSEIMKITKKEIYEKTSATRKAVINDYVYNCTLSDYHFTGDKGSLLIATDNKTGEHLELTPCIENKQDFVDCIHDFIN